MPIGLYIHVPFCQRKCPYCDFYSAVPAQGQQELYTRAVLESLRQVPFFVDSVDTIYFGGGTPSLLGGEGIARILDGASKSFPILPGAEITVECNPHSALKEEIRLMRSAGVNRLSFGMQSASDEHLKLLGRLHTVAEVSSAVTAAQQAGVEHISLDLMLATPGQEFSHIDAAVSLCSRLGVEHVSSYLLKIEEGTPFSKNNTAALCPNEDRQADLYQYAVKALESAGYQQYEISNFCRNGHISRHNLKYWDCQPYLGIGPSAHSFIDGRRRYFPRDLAGFLAAANPWELLQDDGAGGDLSEYLMLRLRLCEGISFKTLLKRYPQSDLQLLRKKARPFEKAGLLTMDDERIRLTVDGFLVSNGIICELADV